MKLIDADELINIMKKWYFDKEKQDAAKADVSPMDLFTNLAITTVREQPTAYDLNKVIGGLYGLKRYENKYDSYYENGMYKMTEIKNDTINSTIDEVIKIVKAGGIS